MKQKRKVKNLLQSETSVSSGNFMTTCLVSVSWGLCLLAITMFAIRSVFWVDLQNLEYMWVNDNTEVVGEVSLIKNDDYSQDMSTLLMRWSSLYVSPKPVIVNWESSIPWEVLRYNNVEWWVYGNILWWDLNNISSENVTVVAWERNLVGENNPNSTVLWWSANNPKYNKIIWNSGKSAVLVWWEENTIDNRGEWDIVIWWKDNTIQSTASNAAILWWKDNTVGWSNVILVWWDTLNIGTDINNAFIFSNDSAIDSNYIKQWQSFYVISKNGLWINTNTTSKWVEIKWAVSIGNIDINTPCQPASIWLQWLWNGCLVSCTEQSKWQWWELLDQGERCRNLCDQPSNIKCINKLIEYVPVPVNGEVTKQKEDRWILENLDDWVVNVTQATRCPNEEPSSFKDVIFETTLIDSEKKCPSESDSDLAFLKDNHAVYRCNENTHLTWDDTWRSRWTWCFADCKLPSNGTWDKEWIRHNQTITWYNVNEVACANDEGDPASTETCGQGTDLGGLSSVHHREVLICIDGTLYLERSRLVKALDHTDSTLNYDQWKCDLKQYRCDTSDWNYNLTMKWTVSWMKIKPSTNINEYEDRVWEYVDVINHYRGVSNINVINDIDRSERDGTKWKYELCIDFDPHEWTNEQCDRIGQNPNDETKYHYKLIGCQEWYATWDAHPYECRILHTVKFDYQTNWLSVEDWRVTGNNWATLTKWWESYTEWKALYTLWSDVDLEEWVAKKTDTRANANYDDTNYQFLWWNTDSDAKVWLTSYTMIDDDVTLYAIYKRTYTATFTENWASRIYPKGASYNPSWNKKVTCEIWNNEPTCTIDAPTIQRDSKDSNNKFKIIWWDENKDYQPNPRNAKWDSLLLIKPLTEYKAITWKDVTVTFYRNGNVSQTPKNWTASTADTVTQTCTIWNSATTCPITSPTFVSNKTPVDKDVIIWYSKSADSHVNDWKPNWINGTEAVPWTEWKDYFEDNTSFYAQSKKVVTITFDKNGNVSQTKSDNPNDISTDQTVTRTCEYYNAEVCCKIKAPLYDPNHTPVDKVAMWYSTEANRHQKDWWLGEEQCHNDNKTYFAQSKKEVTITFDKNGATSQTPKGGTASTAQTVTQKCYYYNAETSCQNTRSENANSIWSPVAVTRANFTVVWYSLNKDDLTRDPNNIWWKVNTQRNDLTDDLTGYAITYRDVTSTFTKDDVSVSAIGTTSLWCTIWNSATDCGDIELPVIACAPWYSENKWWRWTESKLPWNKIRLNDNITYNASCVDITPPECSITVQPTKTPISKVSGYDKWTFTVTCTDLWSKIKTSSLAASAIQYTSTVVDLGAAAVANVTNGKSYTFTYTAKAQWTTTFNLKAWQVSDNAWNVNEATGKTNVVTVDTTKPTCTWWDPSVTIRKSWETWTIVVTCADGLAWVSTTSLSASDFTMATNWLLEITNVVAGWNAASKTFTLTYKAKANVDWNVKFTLPADKVSDVAWNKNDASVSKPVIVDNTAPVIAKNGDPSKAYVKSADEFTLPLKVTDVGWYTTSQFTADGKSSMNSSNTNDKDINI